MIIDDIDTARERADARAIEEMHGSEEYTGPWRYAVTVELMIMAEDKEHAEELANIYLHSNLPLKDKPTMGALIDIEIHHVEWA